MQRELIGINKAPKTITITVALHGVKNALRHQKNRLRVKHFQANNKYQSFGSRGPCDGIGELFLEKANRMECVSMWLRQHKHSKAMRHKVANMGQGLQSIIVETMLEWMAGWYHHKYVPLICETYR